MFFFFRLHLLNLINYDIVFLVFVCFHELFLILLPNLATVCFQFDDLLTLRFSRNNFLILSVEPSDKSVEIMRKFSEQYARKSGTYFCVDKGVTSVVIKVQLLSLAYY